MSDLTVEAGKVPPFEQGCVERGQRCVEEGLASVGGVPDGVSEQVHLQEGLEEVAQHFAGPAHPRLPLHAGFSFWGPAKRASDSKRKEKKKSQEKAKQSQPEELVRRQSGFVVGWWGGVVVVGGRWSDSSVLLPFVLIT